MLVALPARALTHRTPTGVVGIAAGPMRGRGLAFQAVLPLTVCSFAVYAAATPCIGTFTPVPAVATELPTRPVCRATAATALSNAVLVTSTGAARGGAPANFTARAPLAYQLTYPFTGYAVFSAYFGVAVPALIVPQHGQYARVPSKCDYS